MMRTGVWILLALPFFLLSCDSGIFTPSGKVKVTVLPETLGSTGAGFSASLIYAPDNVFDYENIDFASCYECGTNTFILDARPGTFELWVVTADLVAEGYTSVEGSDIYKSDVTVVAGETTEVTARFREPKRANYDYFTVTDYSTASLTLSGLSAEVPFLTKRITASCKEDGYGNLETDLRVENVSVTTEPQTIILSYSSGFSYFTGNTVRCSFKGIDEDNRTVEIKKR